MRGMLLACLILLSVGASGSTDVDQALLFTLRHGQVVGLRRLPAGWLLQLCTFSIDEDPVDFASIPQQSCRNLSNRLFTAYDLTNVKLKVVDEIRSTNRTNKVIYTLSSGPLAFALVTLLEKAILKHEYRLLNIGASIVTTFLTMLAEEQRYDIYTAVNSMSDSWSKTGARPLALDQTEGIWKVFLDALMNVVSRYEGQATYQSAARPR